MESEDEECMEMGMEDVNKDRNESTKEDEGNKVRPHKYSAWEQYSGNFLGRKLSQIDEKYDFRRETLADCSLLQRQECYTPKFRRENFRKQPQNCEICVS